MAVQYHIEEPIQLGEVSIEVMNIVYEPSTRKIPAHSHGSGCYEIHFTPIGYGMLHMAREHHVLSPGTVYVTGPHVEHEQIPDEQEPMQEYCLYLRILHAEKLRPGWLNRFRDTAFWIGYDDGSIHALFGQIFEELAGNKTGYRSLVNLLIQELMIAMTRRYETEGQTADAGNTGQSGSQNTLLIEESFLYEYGTISLPALAGRLHLSTRQTQRLLKNYYGATFQQKKIEAQMSAAVVLLKDKNEKIAEIAEKLGFSSPEHFSGTFKKFFGTSPSSYRRKGAI